MTKHLFFFAKRMTHAFSAQSEKRPWENEPRPSALSERIIALSGEEAAWVAQESRRLMKMRKKEEARKRALGIPPPPTPGKICYAVYM